VEVDYDLTLPLG